MGIAGHQLCLDVFDCYVNLNESNQVKIWWQLFQGIFWLPKLFLVMLSVWKRFKFLFQKYQLMDFCNLVLKCCSKLGHCQAFYSCKPGFHSSNPVAAKFMIFFQPLFFHNSVNFWCTVCFHFWKKVENICTNGFNKKYKKVSF